MKDSLLDRRGEPAGDQAPSLAASIHLYSLRAKLPAHISAVEHLNF